MLGPANLTTAQLKVALKPAAGYEQQLFASTAAYTNPGQVNLQGLNSGVLTTNNADTTQLATTPQELLAVLDNPVNSASPITVTLTGTDQFSNPYTGVANFVAPSYVQTQENVFPKGWGVDFLPGTPGQKCATITGVTVTCAADVAPVLVKIIGLPSFTTNPAQTGAYRLISTKISLKYNLKVPMPHAVQDGRDKSKFVKQGEIEEGTVDISQKVGSTGDGLMRINGITLTGMVQELKENRVETMRVYLGAMTISSNPSVGQSVEDVDVEGKGLAEVVAVVAAKGGNQT